MARFLAIIGPSGSGKSSLVNAGLIPALKQGALPESEKWFIVDMLPGARPLDELEIALSRIATAHADQFYDHLHRDVFGLVRVAKLILPHDGSELVLVIDQFEELFTLTEDESIRRHFFGLLCDAVTAPHSRMRVIITLRADFYDRPLQYPAFGEILCNSMETLLPLSAEELERAIVCPAQGIGVHFEEGLVSKILGDVNDQPGALPLLQYALTELFENREGHMLTRTAYRDIGGTVGALARRIDQVYLDLNEEGQDFTRQMFLRLITLGEGVEDTRRRVPRAELMAIADDEERADEIIDVFVAYRLLSLDHDLASRNPVVEVAHEAILREWERLRQWLN
jgi:energy-coupling factor transporter ATP-binding protein EcfA2